MSERWQVRAGLGVVALCTSAAALYAILRVAQAVALPEPDPALVLYTEHAAFTWRAWIALYAGGMAGLLTWLATERHAERVAGVLARALPIAAALLAAQGLLCP